MLESPVGSHQLAFSLVGWSYFCYPPPCVCCLVSFLTWQQTFWGKGSYQLALCKASAELLKESPFPGCGAALCPCLGSAWRWDVLLPFSSCTCRCLFGGGPGVCFLCPLCGVCYWFDWAQGCIGEGCLQGVSLPMALLLKFVSDQGFPQLMEAAFWPGSQNSLMAFLWNYNWDWAVFVLCLHGPLLTACPSVPLRVGW